MPKIFFPQYRKGKEGVEISADSILDYVRELGVEIASDCGGLGKCGKCVIRIEKGRECLNDKTDQEKKHTLGKDERLVCQTKIIRPESDIYVFIKGSGKYSILSESIEAKVELNPLVKQQDNRVIYHSRLTKPRLPDLSCRQAGGQGSGGQAGEVLGNYEGQILGLAIDVGTTTLAMQVINLENGQVVSTLARKNPQVLYGNDVISRIGHAMQHKNGLEELQKSIIKGINDSLAELVKGADDIRPYIYEVVVVGNSTMRDIFMGQDIKPLGVLPYEPVSCEALTKPAAEIGLALHPQCRVYGPPLIGGHVGADILADVMACGMYRDESIMMLIDIGTNGEVVIGNKDKMMSVSCAAGGAYEGANIKCGTGAVEGAISNIRITDRQVNYETIGGKPPVGICGSGLIDLLAELLRNGIMNKQAKIKQAFAVTEQISLYQEDIYQLITAKAGFKIGQELLMKYYGITLEKIEKIYLAGAFGNFIDVDNSVAIGLLLPAPEKVVRIGNGALAGARGMLLAREMRTQAEGVVKIIEHTKPNEREKDFVYLVAEKMYF